MSPDPGAPGPRGAEGLAPARGFRGVDHGGRPVSIRYRPVAPTGKGYWERCCQGDWRGRLWSWVDCTVSQWGPVTEGFALTHRKSLLI